MLPEEPQPEISRSDTPASRRLVVSLGLLVLLALLLRASGIGNWSLWLDEAMQVDYARRPFLEIPAVALWDQAHPPLSYFVTAVAVRISPTDLVLRLPSILFGAGTVLALFFGSGGKRRFRPAFLAAALFAFLPAAVHYGQEVRPYALALLLVALTEASRRRFARTGDRWAFAGRVLFATGSVYTLHFAVFPVAGGFLLDLIAARRSPERGVGRFRWALLAPAAVLVLYLPWIVALSRQPRRPPEMPAPPVTAARVAELAVGLAADRTESLARAAPAAFVWLIALLGMVTSGERRADLLTLLAASFVLPLVFLQGINHWWNLRYVLLSVLPLSESFGEGAGFLAAQSGRAGGFLLAALLTATAAIEAPALAENIRSARPDWRRPAEWLDGEYRKGRGGTVIAADGWSYLSLRFQTLRLARPIDIPRIAKDAPVLRETMAGFGSGWVVRMPHYPVPKELDQLLADATPWGVFSDVEDARLYRFENGRLIPPSVRPVPRPP